jgi:DNA-binding XRE family transcriptional regulator
MAVKKYKYGSWKFDGIGFASAVRAAMVTQGLNQAEVAELIGVSPATVSVIRNGHYRGQDKLPSVTFILALCNLFDLDIRNYWYVQWSVEIGE